MPRIIKIGKTQENDVMFDSPDVSRHHAEMTIADDNRSALLRDLGSTNGTFVNGKRISQQVTINLSHQLRFGSVNTNLADIVAKLRETTFSGPYDPNNNIIGRDGDCQIRFNYDDVSKHHAVLKLRHDGTVIIEDLHSLNGTFVNDQRIVSQVLKRGDKVTIAGKYPLDWESYYPVAGGGNGKGNGDNGGGGIDWKRFIPYAAALLALLVLGIGGYFLLRDKKYDLTRINKEYSNAICMVVVEYGYKIYIDGEDWTKDVLRYENEKPNDLLHPYQVNWLFGEITSVQPGPISIQGTAFFISKDGLLGTNLHVARPWLFSSEIKTLKDYINNLLKGKINYARSELEIKPVVTKMFITLDGLPLSEGNQIEVKEYKGHEDIQKDVAVLTTNNHKLPDGVGNIIDINEAENNYTEGEIIFYRGYPFGPVVAKNANEDIKGQGYEGRISQDLDDFQFGFDATHGGGASGSPVFNEKGKLVGVLNSGYSGTERFTRGIKVKHLQDLLK